MTKCVHGVPPLPGHDCCRECSDILVSASVLRRNHNGSGRCTHPDLREFTFADGTRIKMCPDCTRFDESRKKSLRANERLIEKDVQELLGLLERKWNEILCEFDLYVIGEADPRYLNLGLNTVWVKNSIALGHGLAEVNPDLARIIVNDTFNRLSRGGRKVRPEGLGPDAFDKEDPFDNMDSQ